jgi:hypothetical protein
MLFSVFWVLGLRVRVHLHLQQAFELFVAIKDIILRMK